MVDGTQKIFVKDIREYPSSFGGNCTLLDTFDLNVYHNTVEEIKECIEKTAKDPKTLEFCL